MVGKLDEFQMDALLRSEILGRIGSSNEDLPSVIPMTYAYDGTVLYSHITEGLKINVLRQNPNVCFRVDKIFDPKNWQCVVVNGKYHELKGNQAQEAIQLLQSRLLPFPHGKPSLPSSDKISYGRKGRKEKADVVFRIEIESMTGRYEKEI